MNLQDRNTGNLGDILKHAALCRLAQWFTGRMPGPVYLESHAYLCRAKLSNPQWRLQTRDWSRRWPAYEGYTALQRKTVTGRRYRCSAALAASYGFSHYVLAENHPPTRKQLVHQWHRLARRGAKQARVYPDFSRHKPRFSGRNLFLHIDPFQLSRAYWHSILPWFRNNRGVALVFQYVKRKRLRPLPAGSWLRAGRLCAPPYFLSVFCSPELLPAVWRLLRELGWTCEYTAVIMGEHD